MICPLSSRQVKYKNNLNQSYDFVRLIFYFIGNSDFWIRGKSSPADRTYVKSTGEWT